MDIFLVLLRFVHVFGGIFWVGGALFMNFFIGPTIGATADVGKQFAGHLMARTRVVNVMTTMAILTVSAGAILYWRDSAGLTSLWMKSGPGIGFAIGGVFGLFGMVFGIIFGLANKQIGMIGSQIKGAPTAEQAAQLQKLQGRLKIAVPIHVYSLLIAATLMAISRYLFL